MTDRIEDVYENHILAHFDDASHRGHLAGASHRNTLRNPVCGDQVELQLLIEANRIQRACFDAKGCVISQAATSILCQHIEGKTITEIQQMQPQHMLDLLKVPLTPTRQQCGLLAFRALKTMLYSSEL